MITLEKSNKTLRNLEEQVQYLTDYHQINQGLAQWGIRVVGQVETADELPLPYGGEYGDAIAVGTQAPFFFYIWTRASIEGEPAYWFPFGEISIVGPQGPKGDKGDKGDTGESIKWYSGSSVPNSYSQGYVDGDMYLQTNGQVYRYQNGSWQSVANIKGPQGIQGIQGPQGSQGIQGPKGEKGDTGDVGGFINIIGQLSSTDQLPLPTQLNNLTYAYLIEHTGGTDQANDHYDLYIQVGQTSATATWFNAGPFNAATLVTVNGSGQNVWDADTKLDKYTGNAGVPRSYGVDATNNQKMWVHTINELGGAVGEIATYVAKGFGNAFKSPEQGGGILLTNDPELPYHCANKKYVDDAIAAGGGGGAKLYKIYVRVYATDRSDSFDLTIVSKSNTYPSPIVHEYGVNVIDTSDWISVHFSSPSACVLNYDVQIGPPVELKYWITDTARVVIYNYQSASVMTKSINLTSVESLGVEEISL